MTFDNGSIWGGATVGGDATLNSVGGLTSLTEGTPPPVPDLEALLAALAARSEQWGDIETAGSAEPYPNGVLLKGTDKVRNVFKVPAATSRPRARSTSTCRSARRR